MAGIPGSAGAGAGYPQWGVVAGSPGQHVTEVQNAAAKYLMESTAFPSKVYFFTSSQAAENWVKGNGGQTYIPGTQTPLNAANQAINTAAGAAQAGLSTTEALAKVYAWVQNRANAVRIVKVVAGGGMILIGITMLVNKETNIGSAAMTVAKVVK